MASNFHPMLNRVCHRSFEPSVPEAAQAQKKRGISDTQGTVLLFPSDIGSRGERPWDEVVVKLTLGNQK